MKHFIALLVLITLTLAQDTTGVVKADCTKDGACAKAEPCFAAAVMCKDPVTQEEYALSCKCVNSAKDPSVCVWGTGSGCPVSVCSCDAKLAPAGTNYICADGTVGGPYCDPTDCSWTDIQCEPYVEKTGYCPYVQPKDDVFCAATTYGTCTCDADCKGTQKCCKNDCNGLSCQDPNPVIVRPGVCPAVKEGTVGICGVVCANDGECGDKQKCCPNACSGSTASTCVNVFDTTTPDTCEAWECPAQKPVTFASTLCWDGSYQGPYCEPNYYPSDSSTGTTDSEFIRQCDWGFHPCPDGEVIHKGSCPTINTFAPCTEKLPNLCGSDQNCLQSEKCCYDGCRLACLPAVADNTCTVTGYKDYYCMDTATAEATATTTNSASDASILPGDDCWYRCKQNSICSYDATTYKCDRDDAYYKCLADCENPDPTPVEPICSHKCSCDCLADTKNECGWCQVKAYTISADGTKSPYTWGYCAPPSGTNVCSASFSTGGNAGNFVTVAPTECTDDLSVDPAIKDTSSFFSAQYEQYRQYFSDINGKLTESALQKVVDTCKGGCDFTIKKILNAVVNTDGNTGSVSCIVEVHTCDKSLEEIGKCIIKGFSSVGIPESNFKDCTLTPYTETAISVKRSTQQTSSTSYLQTATVDPSTNDNTNSAGTLAPIWMMLCVIFLFFRM